MVLLSQRSASPIPFESDRMVRAAAVGLVCVAVSQLLGPVVGDARIVVDSVIAAAFPLLAVATGAVPRSDLKAAADAVRLRSRVEPQLDALTDGDRQLIRMLLADRRPLPKVAEVLGVPPDRVLSRLVNALRAVSGGGHPTIYDLEIGEYLVSRRSVAERDDLARRLLAEGVDPAEMHRLEDAAGQVRKKIGAG
jgi:hypothetical protein